MRSRRVLGFRFQRRCFAFERGNADADLLVRQDFLDRDRPWHLGVCRALVVCRQGAQVAARALCAPARGMERHHQLFPLCRTQPGAAALRNRQATIDPASSGVGPGERSAATDSASAEVKPLADMMWCEPGERIIAMTLQRLALLVVSSLLLAAPACAGPREDAERVRTQLEQAYNAGDWDRAARLFTPNAQYFGSVKDELVVRQEGVRDYLSTLPRGLKLKMEEHIVAQLEPTVMVSSGYVVVTMSNGTQNALKVTMVLHNMNGYWLIAQYHASRVQKPR